MSHNYLLDLNRYLEARLSTLTNDEDNRAAEPDDGDRRMGRLDVLKKFQSMLCNHYYPKLPKRLYRQLAATACEPSSPDIQCD